MRYENLIIALNNSNFPSERFCVLKISFTKKNVTKWKSVKRNFWNTWKSFLQFFVWTFGINSIVKCSCGEVFHSTCFKECNSIAVVKSLWVMINFYKNDVFQLSHGIKTLIEISCTNNIYNWEKAFCSCYF